MADGKLYLQKPSFAGGELTPSLHSRTDLAKYDNGAALLENMIVLRYGGVSRRPGFEHIGQTAGNKKARLIPFRYNTSENYVIEFTAGTTRFLYAGSLVQATGGGIYSIANSFAESELADIKYTQSADVLFLTHPRHPPMTLTRRAHDNWTLETMAIDGGPFEDGNTTSARIGASADTGDVELSASEDFFTAAMAGRIVRLGHTVPSQYASGVPGSNSIEVSCVPEGTVYVESFGFWSGSFTLEVFSDETGTWSAIRTQSGNHSQNFNFTETNKTTAIKRYRVTSSSFDPNPWSSENGNQRGYVVLQTFAQDYYGYVKITGVASGTSASGKVTRRLGATTPTTDFALSAWSPENGYPVCCAFFEDRLVFAGSTRYPQTFWASKSGDYYNFGTSFPSQDDDAITGTLSNGQMNAIRALIPFSELILLSAGSEYKLSGGSNGAWSPSNQQVKVQEYRGINNLTPVVVGSRIIYVQHQGSIVRDFAYKYEDDKYTGDDVSLLATHLFEGHTIKAIAYQQTPHSLVWCVRDDGVLLSMTYIKEQDVYAWHRHTTAGRFIDVCSIAGDNEDELYACVLRKNGYFVERLAELQQPEAVEEQFFVDCAARISGENLKEVGGLDWLEGEEVSVLADGNVLPKTRVAGGRAVLTDSKIIGGYSKAVIGLPYRSELVTLPIEFNGNDGSQQSKKKRGGRMMVKFHRSRGGRFGVKGRPLDEIKWRATEPWGTPIALSDKKEIVNIPQASWEETVQLDIVQDDPLPLTIISIVLEVNASG